MPLASSGDCEGHCSGFREPHWPSCGGKRKKNPGQRRWNEKIMDFLSEVSDALYREESDTPKTNCRTTHILNGRVGYRAFAVRKEDHDRCSK